MKKAFAATTVWASAKARVTRTARSQGDANSKVSWEISPTVTVLNILLLFLFALVGWFIVSTIVRETI